MNAEKLIEKFKKSGLQESEDIELDNLDWARLILNEDGLVLVENEHGTEFPVEDLSETELKIFYLNI